MHSKREFSDAQLSPKKTVKLNYMQENSKSLLKSDHESAKWLETSIVSLEGDESSYQSKNRMSPSFKNPQLQTSIETVLNDDNPRCMTLGDSGASSTIKAVEIGHNFNSSFNVGFDKTIATLEPLPKEILKVKKSFIAATSKRLMTHNRKKRRSPLVNSFEEPSTKVENLETGQTGGGISYNHDNDSLFEMSKT